MPNISKKTAYDVKEASNQSLTKSARNNYAKNAQAGMKDDSPMSMYGSPAKMSCSPMKMTGSWMSKHCSK
jgi:hypothetical protein